MDKDYVLKETLRLLRERYSVGLYEYLYEHRSDCYNQLLGLETRIDETYINPNADVDQLKAILRDYWKLHIIATREFNSIDQIGFNLPKAGQEMTEERIWT